MDRKDVIADSSTSPHGPPVLPQYAGLTAGMKILMVLATILNSLGGLAIFAGGMAMFTDASGALPVLMAGLGMVVVGVLMYVGSAACEALRDVARNSWK